VLSCVGRGLGAGLIPRPRSPTKCLKGSISEKENPTPGKGIRNNENEEEDLIKENVKGRLSSRTGLNEKCVHNFGREI
jgi:hypothetical protein